MSNGNFTAQDKRDLEKFTKFLALKAAQIIVQSRSGDKVTTDCKPNSSGTDWFNLAIRDVPEVLTEAKRALGNEFFSSAIPLCIEISLKTVDGDTMVLEMWSLGLAPEQPDPSVRVTYTVYNRMGILLKSLLSISRITPAYKLSRRQSPDSYIICYRIYIGEPQLHTLGDNYKNVRIGQLCTPVGLIHMSVSYRTKMTISPTQTERDSLMLKSDHFHSEFSPRHVRYQQSDANSKSLSSTIKIGAFVTNKQMKVNEEDLVIPDVPFSSLLTPRQTQSSPPESALREASTDTVTSATNTATPQGKPQIASNCQTDSVTNKTSNISNSSNGNKETAGTEKQQPEIKCTSQIWSKKSTCSLSSVNNDFIMVDLKTPFAGTHTNSDLGAFYRECQSAPQLHAFSEEKTVADQVGDLTKQLESFETDIHNFEDVLSKLRTADKSS